MKKTVLLFAMMLLSIGAFAQSADKIINSYRGNSDIQLIDVNKDMVGMIASQAKTDEEKAAMKSIDSMVMGMIANEALATEIAGKLEALKDKGYAAMDTEKGGMKARILLKQEGDFITEIIMLAKMQGSNVLTQMKGKFDAKQAAALMEKK